MLGIVAYFSAFCQIVHQVGDHVYVLFAVCKTNKRLRD